jgi:hypothetical protein
MTMTCTRTGSTPEPIGAEPSLGARSRTAYGHRDWSPMRVRSSFGYRDSGTAAAPCVERAHPWPPASLVARLNKGLWSLISARFRVEH